MNDPRTEALALWLHTQQEGARIAQQQQQQPPGELHLHQHNYPAPIQSAQPEEYERRSDLPHPLVAAMTMAIVSLAICLPFAFAAAVIEALNQPQIQYIQPSRGGW